MRMLTIMIIPILIFFGSIQGYAQPKKCPVLSELEKTSLKDKKEVIEALNTLIPKTYGTGLDDFPDIYTKWNVVTAKPFPNTVGNEIEEAILEWLKPFVAKKLLKSHGLYV